MPTPRNHPKFNADQPHPVIDVLRLRAISRLANPIPGAISIGSEQQAFSVSLTPDIQFAQARVTNSSNAARPVSRIVLDCSNGHSPWRVSEMVCQLMARYSDDASTSAEMGGRLSLHVIGANTGQRLGKSKSPKEQFKSVLQLWPYWLHFLEPTRQNLVTLIELVCDSSESQGKFGFRTIVAIDQLLRAFDQMFQACDQLQIFCGYSIEMRHLHFQRVLGVMHRCLLIEDRS